MELALSQDTPSGAAEGSDRTRGKEGNWQRVQERPEYGVEKAREGKNKSKRIGDKDEKRKIRNEGKLD